ncbi:MAG TPA: RNA 2',3'-cyclic phosphodiesterase [Blastococcus sp.]|nr:RNA 2',3'-cyclic phosphodiesterase [Blastococcus sp.]
MRLFVALVPPARARAELAAAVRELPPHPRLRWTRPEQWHLTLAFLAEVDDRTRGQLVERLGRVAHRHPPLELSLAGGGRFGAHVLWTRVDGDRAALRRLVDAVRAAARRCGLPSEQRPYRPHLTLARAGPPAPDLAPLVAAMQGFTGSTWPATELHLVRSRLGVGPNGTAQHETVATWELTGRQSGVESVESKARPSR